MFRGMHSDGLYSKEDAASAAAPNLGVATLRHANQESPWIGILSVVSRPALAFLQKYLPGKPRTSTVPSDVSNWQDGDVKLPFKGKNAFLDQLDDFIPEAEHHIAYHLHYHSGANGFGSSSANVTGLSWVNSDSLRELGIHGNAELDLNMRQETPGVGYFASAKNFLSQVLVSAVSGQDVAVKNPEHQRSLGRNDWPSDSVASRVKSSWWWDGIWGSSDSSQGWLSGFSWRACSVTSDQHCQDNDSGIYCQQAASVTAARVAKPTELFEQHNYVEPIRGESAGPSCNKSASDNGSPKPVRPESLPSSEKPLLVCQPLCERLPSIRAATACSEVAVLTPDQDNGYSSLEEEHSNSRMHLGEPLGPGQGCSVPGEGAEKVVPPAGGCATAEVNTELSDVEATLGGREGEEASKDTDISDLSDTEDESQALSQMPSPSCQNKAIAYIMGGPCSEDSESDLEDGGDWDSDDDDGFNSEGSSDFPDSEDLTEEEEEGEGAEEEGKESDAEEAVGEEEQLWNSLCRSKDPYDPRNFTAPLQTAPRRALGEGGPRAAGRCSPQPLLLEEDSWDEEQVEEEEEVSEVDEEESMRLWNSFSCPTDPYSPRNFQGPLRTRQEARAPHKKLSLPIPPSPYLKRDPEEDRIDSGFSEVFSTPDQAAICFGKLKKVRFSDEVEEFYASSDEDRRGPWEEFARDRCRFVRRVQETELAIGYCLAPTFRLLVFNRLHQSC